MGVLDDAIRQHLELKRAHGADEAELQRKENEALGPVRREAEPEADEGAEPAAVPLGDPVAQEPAYEEPVVEEPVALADEEPFAEDEPFADAPPVAEERPAAQAPAPEPPPAAGDTPPRGFAALPAEEPLVEEPAPPAPAPAGEDGEDVLEETPEFLQETPEHDRLWFEQKPPRDFDFDDEEK